MTQGMERLRQNVRVDSSTVDLLRPIHEKVCSALEQAIEAFEKADVQMARNIVASKSAFKEALEQTRNRMVTSLVLDKAQQFSLFKLTNEITLSFERVHTLCRRIAEVVEQAEKAQED